MRTAGKRIAYLAVGAIATMLGLLGIFLPGLPTVPFILLALWAFSNSSQRLHAWVRRLPMLKEVHKEIDQFQADRSISLRIKIISQAMAWSSFVVLLILMKNVWVSVAVGLLALACSACMFFIPTRQTQSD